MLLFAGSAVSIALLPERLRDEFGFHWKLRPFWQSVPAWCRTLRRYTPSILCANPAATLSQLLL
jgi:hypothetical protein